MGMRQFADHVISIANTDSNRICNHQLQKIMYFSIGNYILINGITRQLRREIYDESFEAWHYGPVIRSQYFRFSGYGRYSIRERGEYNEEFSDFDDIIRKCAKSNIKELVDKCQKHSTWWNNRFKVARQEKVEYSLENIQEDFKIANLKC